MKENRENIMPEISRFYGIIIRMYLIDSEHPPKHIHVNMRKRSKL